MVGTYGSKQAKSYRKTLVKGKNLSRWTKLAEINGVCVHAVFMSNVEAILAATDNISKEY